MNQLTDKDLSGVSGGKVVASVTTVDGDEFTPNETAFVHLLNAANKNDHGLDVRINFCGPKIISFEIVTPNTPVAI